ncbi:MAG: hypothetical protein ACJAXR_002052 [Halopseudomonas sp.]|jgi:hypothetical protein
MNYCVQDAFVCGLRQYSSKLRTHSSLKPVGRYLGTEDLKGLLVI